MATRQNQQIEEVVKANRQRLRQFIHSRIDDVSAVDDVLQDVFEEFTLAQRLVEPIGQVASWLMRVARNKIIDRYRKKKPESLHDRQVSQDDAGPLYLADILAYASPSSDRYDDRLIWQAIEEALDELPAEQRDVFVANEIDGLSFRELSEATGVSLNTLLSRKRYAVLHLRRRLQDLYNELFNNY